MENTIIDFGNVSFEEIPRSWIVRGHDEGEGFGGAYSWCFVLVQEGDHGIAKGMISDNKMHSEDIKAIRKFINDNGMKYVKYTRIRPSGITNHILR